MIQKGYYFLFGVEEGVYRKMNADLTIELCTQTSMKQCKPSTSASFMLLENGTTCKSFLPKKYRNRVKGPIVMRGSGYSEWVRFGPMNTDQFEDLEESNIWSVVQEEMESLCSKKILRVLCFVRENQGKLMVEPWDWMKTSKVEIDETTMESGLYIEDDDSDGEVEFEFK
jgi:hypothetical protein